MADNDVDFMTPIAPELKMFGPTKEFYAALVALQAELDPVPKDKNNPFFNSKYADLAGIWKAIKGPMHKHGFALLQPIGRSEVLVTSPREQYDEKTKTSQSKMETTVNVFLTTLLIHKSGSGVSATSSMPMAKADPQGYGSAVTYLRRYQLGAILGIVTDEDDDGNAVSKPQQRQTPAGNGATKKKISEAQVKRLHAIRNNVGMSEEDLDKLLATKGLKSSKDLDKDTYDKLCKYLENLKTEKNG